LEPSGQIKQLISDIDSIFEQVHPLDEPLTLYRGIDNERYVDDIAFISTTYDMDVATTYSGDECCIIVLNVPVGAKVLFVESISQNKDDKEVMLNRGGSFSVTRVASVSKKKHIFVSYVPPDTSSSKDLSKAVSQAEKEDDVVSFIASNISKEEIKDLKEMGLGDEIETIINEIYKKITKSGKPAPKGLIQKVLTQLNFF
jgi:arsenate reductase-like glutaredoxin family protein